MQYKTEQDDDDQQEENILEDDPEQYMTIYEPEHDISLGSEPSDTSLDAHSQTNFSWNGISPEPPSDNEIPLALEPRYRVIIIDAMAILQAMRKKNRQQSYSEIFVMIS